MIGVIESFISTYRKEFDFYEKLAEFVGLKLEKALNKSGVRAIVSYRAKAIDSLHRKLDKRDAETGSKRYMVVDDIYRDIVDLAGVRVALYFPGDIDVVSKIISELFFEIQSKTFPSAHVNDAEEVYQKRFDGYHAKHYRVKLGDDSRYSEAPVEIQIASVLMHAWSEVEHDLVYKPMSGGASKEELMILDEINGMVIAGNIALERLQSAISERINGACYIFQNHYELAAFIAKKIGTTEIINAQSLYDLFRGLNILSKDKIEGVLQVVKQCLDRATEDLDEQKKHENQHYKGGYAIGAILNTLCELHREEVISLICSGFVPFGSLRFKQDLLTFTMSYHDERNIHGAAVMLDALCIKSSSLTEPSNYSIDRLNDVLELQHEEANKDEAQILMQNFIQGLESIPEPDFNHDSYVNLLELARRVGDTFRFKL